MRSWQLPSTSALEVAVPLRDVRQTYAGLVFGRQDSAGLIERKCLDPDSEPYELPHS